jgi:hypothetical protein
MAMMDDITACQRELLALQQGVITRRQALATGLTDKAIAVRLDGGRWQRLHTGVYATFSGQVPRPATLWAAVLRAGPRAVLSHQTAAELYGLLDTAAPVIHVTVPSGSPVARPRGVLLHYSHRLEAARHPTLLPPRTRVEDCLLDMVETASSVDEVIGLVLMVSAKRRTTPERIYAAACPRRRLGWRAEVIQALGAAKEGAHSLLEFRYGTRVERPHGLPRGSRQRLVLRGQRREYQDISYEEYGVVVELDGNRAHPLPARWRDIRRDNLNAAQGLITLRLGFVDVSERPCASAALVGGVLRSRGWEGALRLCGRHCQPPVDNPQPFISWPR